MDRAALAARIQEILKTRDGRASGTVGRAVAGEGRAVEGVGRASRPSELLDVLGGTILDGLLGACVVVDRDYDLSFRHGHHLVERYLGAARASVGCLPWFLEDRASSRAGRPCHSAGPLGHSAGPLGHSAGPLGHSAGRPCHPSFLFFDLETTGLSGGAGTLAFLAGFGFFTTSGFHTRQFFLRGYGEERAQLETVREFAAGYDAPTLVTYNGRSFDVPLIDTRYQFHRTRSPFTELAHLDMLFPARRLWRRRLTRDEEPGSCALSAIERDILGVHRVDDVPGFEIPARYFAYARSGDARGLVGVLEHNRLDLLSLAAVMAIVLDMVREGAEAARDRHDCLALGRLYEYLGRLPDAERCYVAAATRDGTIEIELDRLARAESLHWLARHLRRTRRFQAAAEAWRELSEIVGLDVDVRREALEALAVHHEHRAKDLEAARTFARRALDLAHDARHSEDVQHRLGRLDRKLTRGPQSPPDSDIPGW